MIDKTYGGAFKLSGDSEFYDFIYFHLIMLTSIGFGDITPIHPLTKGVTMIISVLGQL
ncbi:MAG: ion channel [Bacteroidota bacterium]